MYIWFDGVAGTGGWRGVLGEEVGPADVGACLGGVSDRPGSLFGEFDPSVGIGGGKGDIESAVTEAEGCALYVRSGWNVGVVTTCCRDQHSQLWKLEGSSRGAWRGTHYISIVRAYNLSRRQHM